MQKNLKLTSVRLDPDMLEKVAKFQKDHYYWTKNAIINAVLVAVFEDFPDQDIYDMVRCNRVTKSPILASYRIVKAPDVNNANQEETQNVEDIK